MNGKYHYIREGQPGTELFTFIMKSEDLLRLSKVERFNEEEEGVQRELNYPHVQKLATFMRRPDASLPEPILGDLRGNWQFDPDNQVIEGIDESALIIVDDGQQRVAALRLLTPEERACWEFKVTVSVNTPFRERLARFVQQLRRLKLDPQLVLQIQDRGDLWPDGLSKSTYQLAKRLALDVNSPLMGLLQLRERSSRRQPAGEDAEKLKPMLKVAPMVALREQTINKIQVSWILRDLRQLLGSAHSGIRQLTQESQFTIVTNLLRSAQQTWPDEWNNPKDFFLRRGYGIAALLQLLVVGTAFKEALTVRRRVTESSMESVTTQTEESIKRVLGYAKRYDWSFQAYRGPQMKFPRPVDMARQLDALIYQSSPRKKTTPPRSNRAVAAR